MQKIDLRADGRSPEQMRPLNATFNVFEYAPGSLLFECGRTKILCAVTIQPGVPSFLRGSGKGWLTAEYALLPASTHSRTQRDSSQMRPNKRTVEISRLISRALRAVCDLSVLGERTIYVDCDVLQADGGTRVTSISAASVALHMAQDHLLKTKQLAAPFINDGVAAVSVGVHDDEIILDPDYQEDSAMQADFNVIITKSGNLVEIQGGAEHGTIAWDQFDRVREVAQKGVHDVFAFFETCMPKITHTQKVQRNARGSLFSLGNRLQS